MAVISWSQQTFSTFHVAILMALYISNTEGYVSCNSSSCYLWFYKKFKKKEKHFCTCILIYRGEIKDGWWKPHVSRKIWESVYLLWKWKEFLRASYANKMRLCQCIKIKVSLINRTYEEPCNSYNKNNLITWTKKTKMFTGFVITWQ